MGWKDPNTKASKEALKLISHLLCLFTAEALGRADRLADEQASDRITIDHIEAILPQLLLDF